MAKSTAKPTAKPKSKSGVKPHLLTHPVTGEAKTRAEWAAELGIPLPTLQQQLHRDKLGKSKRKWWQGSISQGPRPNTHLLLGREYEHRRNGLRCWLEWFTPDEDVLRGKTLKVHVRVCGNDPNCSQTMHYTVFAEEFRLIGSPKAKVRQLPAAALNMIVEQKNRFRTSPKLIPVIKEGTPERRTRSRPTSHMRLLGEIANREY